MEDNLVIVESPAKAKTIEKFLGKDFKVKSSYGHIRDLAKKDFGVDLEHNYKPNYIVPSDKKQIVSELKKDIKKVKNVWLASDEDREGEAIAWHLCEVLKLNPEETKRIVFHEITKPAINKAIENPRSIDMNLVNAQQARRILDRIVGFELSPVLWKKIKPSLSAGRVQSVAVRLLVEREREIINHKPNSAYRIIADFISGGKSKTFKAEYEERPKEIKEAQNILETCKGKKGNIESIKTKPSKKKPAAPFTTSTLQQEASRKLGYSVSQTMRLAQKLYEAGLITYMRTDSVNLSEVVVNDAAEVITSEYGKNYCQIRQYSTKSKGAQEAHEAIRPTYIKNKEVKAAVQEQKLYNLIWKRTIASQMKDAELEKTTVKIKFSGLDKNFTANGEMIKFPGFMKVYQESHDDDKQEENPDILPPLTEGQDLAYKQITATEKFTNHPPRYTEASLVRKLEELGIGRPSTYAPTISTIQNRGYVVKESRDGKDRDYSELSLKNQKIESSKKVEITGAEKNKLFPCDIGMVVNDFLVENFQKILDFNFTAEVEKQFDDIASGSLNWDEMLDKFYKDFHPKVTDTLENKERSSGKRILGKDPKTGNTVSVRVGRYGPVAQIGEPEEVEKPQYANLRKKQYIETIALEEALDLFKLPRTVGEFEGEDIIAAIGRFGPYVKHKGLFASLGKNYDPMNINLDEAINLIKEKREAESKKLIKEFKEDSEIRVLNGRYGPYINKGKKNYRIPKKTDPEKITFEEALEIIKKKDEKK